MGIKSKIIGSFVVGLIAGVTLVSVAIKLSRKSGTRVYVLHKPMSAINPDDNSTIIIPAGVKLLQGDCIPFAIDESSVYYLPIGFSDFTNFPMRYDPDSDSPTFYAVKKSN